MYGILYIYMVDLNAVSLVMVNISGYSIYQQISIIYLCIREYNIQQEEGNAETWLHTAIRFIVALAIPLIIAILMEFSDVAAYLASRRGSRDSQCSNVSNISNEDIGPLNFNAHPRVRQRRTSNFLELPGMYHLI